MEAPTGNDAASAGEDNSGRGQAAAGHIFDTKQRARRAWQALNDDAPGVSQK